MRLSPSLSIAAAALSGLLLSAQADTLSGLAKSIATPSAAAQALPDSDIAAGIKQALAKGTRTAVNQLGRQGGFWDNARFRIPLPGPVEKVQGLLKEAGMGAQVEQLHLTINRAAEQAVPVAADVFAQAVQKLTIDDARQILAGPPDAATQYFKRTTSAALTAKFEPIVAGVTSRLGVVQQYDKVMAAAGPLAGMLGGNPSLNDYVTRKALAALFTRVGEEEKSIRENPAARTTDLLKAVFGAH
ncbi:MAG: DUF4197 domain-containing protein [Gammaproteobacteria bacterium]|nr:DUF4197 domain-containing protein [Gammaproteobacteria bacterium]